MKENEIPFAVHYPLPLNKQPAVLDPKVETSIGDKLSEQVLSLPMHAYMTDEVFKKITQTLTEVRKPKSKISGF